MLTVHHLAASQSIRIVWLCEELELPYRLLRYERDPATYMAPPEFKALHPGGMAPVITDGELVLGESGAIVEYIAHRHGGEHLLRGPDHPDFVSYLYWFHFANGTMVPGLMMDWIRANAGIAQPEEGVPGRTERSLAMIEQRLGEAPCFAGDEFTAADIMMCLASFLATRDLAGFPNIGAYLRQISSRPGWQRAIAKAEPGVSRESA